MRIASLQGGSNMAVFKAVSGWQRPKAQGRGICTTLMLQPTAHQRHHVFVLDAPYVHARSRFLTMKALLCTAIISIAELGLPGRQTWRARWPAGPRALADLCWKSQAQPPTACRGSDSTTATTPPCPSLQKTFAWIQAQGTKGAGCQGVFGVYVSNMGLTRVQIRNGCGLVVCASECSHAPEHAQLGLLDGECRAQR